MNDDTLALIRQECEKIEREMGLFFQQFYLGRVLLAVYFHRTPALPIKGV